MITLSQQHDLNNISLTEIGNNTFQSLSFLFITKFSEGMIRDESTKIVKDEISEFLRLEFDQNRVTCTVVPERLTHFWYPRNRENVSIFPEKNLIMNNDHNLIKNDQKWSKMTP